MAATMNFPYESLRLLSIGVLEGSLGNISAGLARGVSGVFCVFDLQVITSSSHILKSLSLEGKYLLVFSGNRNSARFEAYFGRYLHSCMENMYIDMWNPPERYKHFQISLL